MFLNDNTFNGADVAALAGLGALAVGGQRFVNRRQRRPGLAEREYPSGSSLTAIRKACAQSSELSRSRRGLA